MPLAVNEQSASVRALAEDWPVCEALMGGTPAMRKAGASYLPKWPGETTEAYRDRLNTATLFPAYRRTVSVMAGKPFAKALTLSDDTPASIRTWAEDIDRGGVNLHAFAAELFEESFYGLAGILVEFPDTRPRGADGRPLPPDQAAAMPAQTVAQAEASGARPYFVRVLHSQILGWQTATTPKGVRLSQLRIAESREEPDGPYGTKTIEQVRVLTPGRWEVWEQGEAKGAWAMVDAGATSLDEIPFVPVYGRRLDFMRGAPTLLDLAHLNVKHWQSQSDQDTILHVARVPILAVKGVETFALTLGASTAVNLGTSPDADMKFVEHSGGAIGAGETSLRALETQMVQMGAELLVKTPGDRSATESAGDQEGNKSDLQRLTEQFEDALDQALWLMAQYARLPTGGSVSLFKDFGAATLSDASAQLVADLNSRGLLSRETTLREMQRRGVIEASVDVEEELALAAEEGPALGELSDGQPPATPKREMRITRNEDGSLTAQEQ